MLRSKAVRECISRSFKVVCLVLFTTTGCTQSNEPACTNPLNKSRANTASCVVVHQGSALVVTLLGGSVAFPEDSPNGRESALCAAERAVWSQAGLSVEAASLLAKFDDGTHFYHCKVLLGLDLDVKKQMGIVDVRWVPVSQLRNLRWQDYQESSVILARIPKN